MTPPNLCSCLFAFLLLCLIGSAFSLYGQNEVSVSANIESSQAFESYPLIGLLTITHNPQERVDPTSIQLEGKPLPIEIIKTVPLSPKLQISMYRFQLPAKTRGSYMLPEITVKVGEKEYRSLPSYYNVTAAKSAELRKVSSADQSALLIEAVVDMPKAVYPGQKLRFIYRFGFRGNIALTKEELPLLEAKGFHKLGEKVVKEYVTNGFNVHEVIQEVEAVAAGTFSYLPAVIEGYAYEEDPVYKKRTYIEPILRAESVPVTIEVTAFPPGKPSSFTGAVGRFSFKSQLTSPHEVPVESRVSIKLEMESKDLESLATVALPDLKNLPGLQGLFRLGDLPSVGVTRGLTKQFTIEMYPLSPEVKQIPSIEFSYFDPSESKYVRLHSQPIPITVIPLLSPSLPSKDPKIVKLSIPPSPPESIYLLNAEDLQNPIWGSWNVFLLVPVAFLMLTMGWFLKRLFPQWNAWQKKTSIKRLWKKLQRTSPESEEFFSLLNDIFILKLYELGKISTVEVNLEELPAGKVRTFLEGIQEARFTGKKISEQWLLKEAKKLFKNSHIWLFLFFVFANSNIMGVEEPWEQADAWVKAGESSTLLQEFKGDLNNALSLYSKLETTYHPSLSTGRLYYNIGNTYFQLGEYPLAIFYYLRANALMPREQKVIENLNSAFSHLGLASYPRSSWMALSLPEELSLFAFMTATLTILLLVFFYYSQLKKVCWVWSILWLILLLHLGWARYISPIEAVVIQPTLLYVEARERAERVSVQPVLPGTVVDVLMVLDEGRWLKIQVPSGDVGYVPYSAAWIV